MNIFQKLEANYLIAPKILYLVVNLQYYGLHQFRANFAREKFHVTTSQLGFFSGLIMFTTFFTNILIGGISDKTKKPKGMLLFLTMITTAIFMGFYIDWLTGISIYIFWSFMLAYLVFNNPKQPLLDKIILDYLSSTPSGGPEVYGKQRLWGTLAYGAATYLCEMCLSDGSKTVDGKKAYNYDNLIYYTLITTIISAVSIIFLIDGRAASEPEPAKEEVRNHQSESQSRTENQYLKLLKNSEYLFFIFIIFFNAITRSAMSFYLNIFHREVLNVQPYDLPDAWPSWLQIAVGLLNNKPITTLTLFGIAFEIIVMGVSGGIINKLGLFVPLLLAQLFALVRFYAYYAMSYDSKNVYGLSCIFELFKGIYFGLAHISAVQIATRLAPSNLKATSQMIYQGTFTALGSLVSGLVFSKVFDSKLKNEDEESKADSFRTFFVTNGFISFVTILVFIYKYGIKDKVLMSREKEEEKLNSANVETEVPVQ